MANPNALTLLLEADLRRAISHVIQQKRPLYGDSMFFIKLFMDTFKDDLIAYWNSTGKDGQRVYNKYYEKWTVELGLAEENKENQKQREIAAKKELFQLCGCSEESAKTLAEMSKDKTESIDNVMKVLAKKNNLQPQ